MRPARKILNGIPPAPMLGHKRAKVRRWDLIDPFPLTWSLFRFHFSDFPPVVLMAKPVGKEDDAAQAYDGAIVVFG